MAATAVAHYYRKFRSGRYGSGELFYRPAEQAYASAKSFVAFRERLSADVKADKARSKAAKKGWKTRRASGMA